MDNVGDDGSSYGCNGGVGEDANDGIGEVGRTSTLSNHDIKSESIFPLQTIRMNESMNE